MLQVETERNRDGQQQVSQHGLSKSTDRVFRDRHSPVMFLSEIAEIPAAVAEARELLEAEAGFVASRSGAWVGVACRTAPAEGLPGELP